MIDLALNKTTHDMLYAGNDMLVVDTLDAVIQNLKQRLSFYLREWFLDTTEGINYYDDILVKNPNIPSIESIFKAKIFDTTYVTELLEFQGVYTVTPRNYSVTFKAQTIFGIAELSQSIF